MTRIVRRRKAVKIVEETVETQCDRCNEVIPTGGVFDNREFELSFWKGSHYPEGSYGNGWGVSDLCDNCAEWLRKMLEDGGVKVVYIKSDTPFFENVEYIDNETAD